MARRCRSIIHWFGRETTHSRGCSTRANIHLCILCFVCFNLIKCRVCVFGDCVNRVSTKAVAAFGSRVAGSGTAGAAVSQRVEQQKPRGRLAAASAENTGSDHRDFQNMTNVPFFPFFFAQKVAI